MIVMQSRLLRELDAAIASAPSLLDSDCLRAERACYFARQGRLAEAESEIKTLRSQYQRAPNAAMSAWLSLAEGLAIYFTNFGAGSRDKVLRAHALSAATGLVEVQALSAAWLAQMAFTTLDIPSLSKYARQALKLAGPTSHSARARASLVVAQALHVAGEFDSALPWYRRTHTHATAIGDDATISALMHNMDCMRLDNLRQAKLSGVGDSSDIDLALVRTRSTNDFDEWVGASSLKALKPLLRARIHSLQGQQAEALALYHDHIALDTEHDYSRMESDLLSDVAWCRFCLGDHEAALASAEAAEASLRPETQIDDRAATHTRLSWLYAAMNDPERAGRHKSLAAASWSAYVQLQERIVEELSGMSAAGEVGAN